MVADPQSILGWVYSDRPDLPFAKIFALDFAPLKL